MLDKAVRATGNGWFFLSNSLKNSTLAPLIDSVTIDAKQLLIQLNVDDVEIARRSAEWKAPAPRYTRGVLGKYFKLVGTTSKGAVKD